MKGSFSAPLSCTKIDARQWRVDFPIAFKRPNGETIVVPKGFVTDFASVPRILWGLYPPDGKYTEAAVVHDWLYNQHDRPRSECDQILLEGMEALNVSWLDRHNIYWAVRGFGWMFYGKNGNDKFKPES